MTNTSSLTIGIVAGEVSGDALGGDFMQKMKALHPNIRWVGVGGRSMAAQGLSSVIDMGRLSVMGLAEVMMHLPDLLKAKKQIITAFKTHQIDLFIGIDAPDFNLRIGKILKPQGVFCVQYVSPSIWAWREGRIHHIKAATDLVLCLFPFELGVYQKYAHPAVCVGHPLLNKLHAHQDSPKVRLENFIHQYHNHHHSVTSLTKASHIICLMAGSRTSEIRAMLPLLLTSAQNIHQQIPTVQFVLPVVSAEHTRLVHEILHTHHANLVNCVHILDDHNRSQKQNQPAISHACMTISDVVLLASGTATLECLLLERPMVVVYQVNPLTFMIAKRLVKIPYVSLPNILAKQHLGHPIVPELLQSDATAEKVSTKALGIIHHPNKQTKQLSNISAWLRSQSHQNSAKAVLDHYFMSTKKSYDTHHITKAYE